MFSFVLPVYITFAFAEEGEASSQLLTDTILQLLDEADFSELEKYISSKNLLEITDFKSWLFSLIDGGVADYASFLSFLLSPTVSSLKQLLPDFVTICAVSCICGILNAISSSFGKNGNVNVIFFACYSLTIVVILARLSAVFTLTKDTVTQMSDQMQILFPLLLTFMSASGGNASVAVYDPAVSFLSVTISNVFLNVVLPLTIFLFIFQAVTYLNREIDLSNLIKLLKSCNKWIIGVCATIYSVFLSVQGITSASYDGISFRAAKYAISNSVPVVGNFLSGGFDLVLAGNVLIKNSVGVTAVLLLVAVLFQPLITIFSFTLLLRFSASISSPVGDKRISDFLNGMADVTGYLTATLLCMGLLYFVTILLLILSSSVLF